MPQRPGSHSPVDSLISFQMFVSGLPFASRSIGLLAQEFRNFIVIRICKFAVTTDVSQRID
jgi:hypothetical protein